MKRSHVLQLALMVVGLPISLLLAASVLAWKFAHDPALGEPVYGFLYDPLSAWRWWRAWGHEPAYRGDFLNGLATAFAVGTLLLPMLAMHMITRHGPLWLEDRDPDQGLGTPRDLLRTGEVATSGDGIVLGHGRRGWNLRRAILRDHGDGHAVVAGRARGGKGVGFVIPTLLTARRPVFVFDPKAELASITGRFRRSLGPTHVMNPTDPASARCNPLSVIPTDHRMIGVCRLFAAMLAYGGESKGEQKKWDDAACEMFTALLVQLCVAAKPEHRHLGQLWAMVNQAKAGRYPVASHPLVADWIAGHKKMFQEVRDSVNWTASTSLAFLADPLVRHVLSGDDFSLCDLAADSRPTTLFVTIPDAHAQSMRPFSRLLFQAFFSAMTADLHAMPDGRPKVWDGSRQVLGLIDEFPRLGKLDAIEHGIATCAGYGLRLMLICQDFDQIKSIYGAYQGIVSVCSTIAVIPGFSGSALKAMQEWAGEQAVAHASRQRGARGSLSEAEHRQHVLNSRDMVRRGGREALVFKPGGPPPTWLRKVRYWRCRDFRGWHDPAKSRVVVRQPTALEDSPPWLSAA